MELRRKRAYDTASADDGFRVLVDRLWPRGMSKERAAINHAVVLEETLRPLL